MTPHDIDKSRKEAMKTHRLTTREVSALFGVKPPALYHWMARENDPFPEPKRSSPRRLFWYEYDVRSWAERQGLTLSDGV